jgi:hypothetical protein
LQHFITCHIDPRKPKFGFWLNVDEVRVPCMGKTPPAPVLPKTAFPRYVIMVRPRDDSASNPGIFISNLLFVFTFNDYGQLPKGSAA